MNGLVTLAASNYAAVAGELSVESLTYYLFWLACVCMGAATLFFFLERTNVPTKYRTTWPTVSILTVS